MMGNLSSQWQSFIFWVGAVLLIILGTVYYQPAAAKTGSLLVWTQERLYVMDIDSLSLFRVGPAKVGEPISPSPGCFGRVEAPCWVVVSDKVYRVDQRPTSQPRPFALPLETGWRWAAGPVSWSPDGLHLAYGLVEADTQQTEWRIYDVATRQTKIKVPQADLALAVTWSAACATGLEADGCELGYKKAADSEAGDELLLIGFRPASGQVRQWPVSPEPISSLRWSPDGTLLYSRPARHFMSPATHSPAYQIPPGSRLANLSPDARHVVYYQPFTLEGCQSGSAEGDCLHLGIWLAPTAGTTAKPKLIYSVDLSIESQAAGLNFIPTWSSTNNGFVFFQGGKLIHYDLIQEEATIWYKAVGAKLRSVPVFSPNETAVAFVDNQGGGVSEYRLVVVNPRLQPVEHVIQMEKGFRVLAWMPN